MVSSILFTVVWLPHSLGLFLPFLLYAGGNGWDEQDLIVQ